MTTREGRDSADAEESLGEQVRRVAAGEPAAFAAIVVATTPRLHRLAARIMADADEAEDVLQEAYLRAFDALVDRRFDGRSGAYTWLYRIVTNAAVDALRSRRRRTRRLDPDGELDSPVDGEERLAARAALRELGALLDDLPSEQRTAVVLKELEGLSSNEVAEVMDCSVGAVEQRLVRARAALRRRIERD
ncbi:MAG: RNA polymerase sigma factor [Byssovorax sp.]